MDLVPGELLNRILCHLDPGSKLNAALCCRHWLRLLLPHLPELKFLNISLDNSSCEAHIQYRTEHDTSAALCQCAAHARQQSALLGQLLAQFGRALNSIQLEDNLLNRCSEECIQDYPFHVILRDCDGRQLHRLSLHCVDLSSVRVWTLSALAKYSTLNTVSFEECKFPRELSESLFLRMLAPSFGAIQVLRITDNSLVTDKLGIQVAKRCVRLSELSLRGCANITAVTVVAFCEHLASPKCSDQGRPLPVGIDLRETAFDSMELARHLNNPLLRCNPFSWTVQAVTVTIGFDRKALMLAERDSSTAGGRLAMTVFVD